MKTGLFFGSFNPVHIGHLIMGSYFAQFTDLKQVWYLVSPHNPLKEKKELLNEYERLEMLRLATEDDPNLNVSDIEFHLDRPSFTINTLVHLGEKHPDRQWVLLMGSDTLQSLPKWRNYDELLAGYEIYVYPRPGHDFTKEKWPDTVKLVEGVPLMEISASFIRNAIKEGKSMKHFLPEKVYSYIDKWGFYL